MPRLVASRPLAALLLLAGASLAPYSLASDEPAKPAANLGPTFVEGTTARYEVMNSARQIIAAQGQQLTADINSVLTLTVKVEEVNDTGARVTATIDAIESFIHSPALFAEFNSAEPTDNDGASILGPALRPIVGKSFSVTLTPTGSTANVEGVDTLLPAEPNMQQLVAQAIGAQGLGTAVVGFFVLKDGMEPIEEGSGWEDTQVAGAPPLGTITITTNATLASIAEGVAKVTIVGNASFQTDPAATQQGMTVEIEESEISGEVQWDTKSDMLRSSTSKNVMMLTMRNAAFPDTKQSVRVENESTAKRLD